MFLKPFKKTPVRVLSGLKSLGYASCFSFLHPIKHSCSFFKQYIFRIKNGFFERKQGHKFGCKHQGRYVFNWGGGPGLRRGGSLVLFLQIGEGQTCFILNPGRVIVFFGMEKLLHVASILYTQAKLPVEIDLNYLQVSKNLLIKKLSSPN